MNRISPFNNSIEAGLRILTILASNYPESYDIQSLIYLDYLLIHSSDLDKSKPSLHPEVANRKGELFVRRELIIQSIELYSIKGLINIIYTPNGIEYKATEKSIPFIDSLTEEYYESVKSRANWLTEFLIKNSMIEIHAIMDSFMNQKYLQVNIIENNE